MRCLGVGRSAIRQFFLHIFDLDFTIPIGLGTEWGLPASPYIGVTFNISLSRHQFPYATLCESYDALAFFQTTAPKQLVLIAEAIMCSLFSSYALKIYRDQMANGSRFDVPGGNFGCLRCFWITYRGTGFVSRNEAPDLGTETQTQSSGIVSFSRKRKKREVEWTLNGKASNCHATHTTMFWPASSQASAGHQQELLGTIGSCRFAGKLPP